MIPKQLLGMKFCKIYLKSKKPYELEWTTKNNYSYNEMINWLKIHNENYGVLTGIDSFAGFDDDSDDNRLIKKFDDNFEETFAVRDHKYIYLDGWNGKKITLYDENGKKIGEVQGKGQQLVGAGSTHPTGAIYDIKCNKEIIHIDYTKFLEVFKDNLKLPKVYERQKVEWEGEDIKSIPITNIFSSDLNKCPSCGCSSGTNFKVYPNTNSYMCFHEWSGGGIWEAIAIDEGIKSCSEIGRSCMSESESQEILKVAREKYGLRTPEPVCTFEPIGWAKSINIKTMAERKGFNSCPKCNTAFEFNEKLGWFKCPCTKGGIKKLMALFLMQEIK